MTLENSDNLNELTIGIGFSLKLEHLDEFDVTEDFKYFGKEIMDALLVITKIIAGHSIFSFSESINIG